MRSLLVGYAKICQAFQGFSGKLVFLIVHINLFISSVPYSAIRTTSTEPFLMAVCQMLQESEEGVGLDR